jgi:hypothetical protein
LKSGVSMVPLSLFLKTAVPSSSRIAARLSTPFGARRGGELGWIFAPEKPHYFPCAFAPCRPSTVQQGNAIRPMTSSDAVCTLDIGSNAARCLVSGLHDGSRAVPRAVLRVPTRAARFSRRLRRPAFPGRGRSCAFLRAFRARLFARPRRLSASCLRTRTRCALRPTPAKSAPTCSPAPACSSTFFPPRANRAFPFSARFGSGPASFRRPGRRCRRRQFSGLLSFPAAPKSFWSTASPRRGLLRALVFGSFAPRARCRGFLRPRAHGRDHLPRAFLFPAPPEGPAPRAAVGVGGAPRPCVRSSPPRACPRTATTSRSLFPPRTFRACSRLCALCAPDRVKTFSFPRTARTSSSPAASLERAVLRAQN